MTKYDLGYLLLLVVSIGIMVTFACGYDIVQMLDISKTTFIIGLMLIQMICLGSLFLINKYEKIHYKRTRDEQKERRIDNVRKILENNNVKEEIIKDRIDFLEKQNLTKVKEIEEKLQEEVYKNRKDEINEYNFFNPIENKSLEAD